MDTILKSESRERNMRGGSQSQIRDQKGDSLVLYMMLADRSSQEHFGTVTGTIFEFADIICGIRRRLVLFYSKLDTGYIWFGHC